MKVILKESIEKLGNEGDVVNVKPGYGRNYLIPQAKAVLATPGALRTLENEREAIERRVAATIQDAEKLKDMLEKTNITIEVNVGEEDSSSVVSPIVKSPSFSQRKDLILIVRISPSKKRLKQRVTSKLL